MENTSAPAQRHTSKLIDRHLPTLADEDFGFAAIGEERVVEAEELIVAHANGVPINLIARLLIGQRPHHAGASASAGIGRGMRDGLIDLLVADDSLDHPALVQIEIEAPRRVEVVVFQIQTLDPSILPVQPLFPHEVLQQPLLGHPIDAINQAPRIVF